MKACLFHIWDNLEGDEPSTEGERWMEVNGIFSLFHPAKSGLGGLVEALRTTHGIT